MQLTELAERFYTAVWGKGELDVVDEICAPDVKDHHHCMEGRDAVQGVVAQLRATFPDLRVEVERQIASEDHVVSHLRFRATDRGGLFAMGPTERPVDFTAVFIDRFEGQRLVEHWGVSDMMSVFRQLGIIPEDWQADRPLVAS